MVFCNAIHERIFKRKRSHNPYFNRWFSAICKACYAKNNEVSHNPYFNRWFSAIVDEGFEAWLYSESQSLF